MSAAINATSVLADFGRWNRGEIIAARGCGDWQTWAHRLAAELRSLLAVAVDQAAALDVARDALADEPVTGFLSAADVADVLDALTRAAEARRELADYCTECSGQPDSPLCPACTDCLTDADRFDALAARLAGGTDA